MAIFTVASAACGAATGVGLDFPYPNFTGPATAMGHLFAHAILEIRTTDRTFSRARLEELYERPLRNTHYFKNVEFLEKWPHYVEHTRVFFGRAADLATGTLYIASNPSLGTHQKLWQLAKFTRETLPLKQWVPLFRDLREQRDALGLKAATKPSAKSFIISSSAGGKLHLDFCVDGEPLSSFLPPISVLFRKAPQILAVAADHLYRNDDTTLPVKLSRAIRSARHSLSLFDHIAFPVFAALLLVLMPIQWICELIWLIITRPSPEKFLSGFFQKYRALTRDRVKLDPDAVRIEQPWEEKLSLIRYFSEHHSHIKVFRPENFENRAKIAESPLWHVCPARVYECLTDDLGQSQLVVNFENCVKCETCWRSAPNDVDWTRQRKQRLIYSAPTIANAKLLALQKSTAPDNTRSLPREVDITGLALNTKPDKVLALSAKLHEFSETVYAGPRYVDAGRTRWLQHLLVEAQPIAADIKNPRIDQQIARIVVHAKRRKFFWAEADARQLLEHLPPPPVPPVDRPLQTRIAMVARLEKLFSKQAIKDLEHGNPLAQEQRNFLHVLAEAASPPRDIIPPRPGAGRACFRNLLRTGRRPTRTRGAPMDRPHGCPQCVERICAGTNPDTAANRHRPLRHRARRGRNVVGTLPPARHEPRSIPGAL